MHRNNPNKLRRVATCGVLALILAVIVADILTDFALYPWDLVVMIAGAAVWFLLFFALWRCPHCGKFLPKSDGDLAFCPYCGQNLPQDR
ncbi:MAG: hypothetical protein SOY66_06225 [Evtepia sp.]|nr:hypothetical protein [Evtepia sp.]